MKSEPNVFEKFAENVHPKTQEVGICEGMVVSVKSRISFIEMLELVKKITDACIDEERGEVHYALFNTVAKLFITAVYCGIDVPADIETGYAAVRGQDGMYNMIEGYIDRDQLEEIWDSCEKVMRDKAAMFSSAAAQITISMVQRMNELYEMIGNMADDFNDGDMAAAVNNLMSFAQKNN